MQERSSAVSYTHLDVYKRQDLASKLLEELNCDTAFTIPLFGGIEIAESVVVTWIIMAALVIISILLTRNLQVEPENISKRQLALETVIGVIQDFFKDILGEKGKMYIPYLMSVADVYKRQRIR